jgi:hypothetical protein
MSNMYIDDTWGITLRKCLQHDSDASLLGPNAIADHKTESGTRLDVIGWNIDLTRMFLTIAKKNLLNAFYAYFTEDTKAKANLKMMQK